jgi:hypothetical protein
MIDVSEGPSLQQSQPGDELEKGGAGPKSWFLDPYLMLDHMGLGYRASPSKNTSVKMTRKPSGTSNVW